MKILAKFILLLALFSSSLFGENEKVTLQLEWLNQFQFAGFYIAKERGFYDEVGLDVEIKEFDNSLDVIDEVVKQNAEFGITRSSVLIDIAQGKPLVVLGATFQHTPSVLISTNPKIKTIQDLKHKRIMVTNDEASGASIMSMLLSNSITLENIKIQKHSFKLDDLVNGKTDAMACYLSNEPYFLEQRNIPYKIFNPRDYGFDFYGDIIFTSESQMKNHPKRTKAFYEASMKGWRWAFSHIDESAKIIYEKYNTQHKTFASLIYEGQVLKKLAFDKYGHLGLMDMSQIDKMADIYRLSGLLDKKYDFHKYIDPLGYNKENLHLGVLAKRGKEKSLKRWQHLADYLNKNSKYYHINIYPLKFNEIEEAVKNRKIDFLLTNTMNYVQLENKYGISRLVTLKNRVPNRDASSYFGSVLFSKKSSKISTIGMLKGKKFAAVDRTSFGGWVMALELLSEYGLSEKDIDLQFYGTHDGVVEAVLDGRADVGTVRTDTLERMAEEHKIDLHELNIIHAQKYDDFPFLVSTKLYPEWPLAKLHYVSEKAASEIMVELIAMNTNSKAAIAADVAGWTVPLDYYDVHTLLKKLKLAPYDNTAFSLGDVVKEYAFWIYTMLFLIVMWLLQYINVKRLNRHLDIKVKEQTRALTDANKRLKELADKDGLTGIYNRRHFLELAEQYFTLSKRNNEPMQILSLDIDYFKNVNDSYGHDVGDIVLKLFCQNIETTLRESDIFGRVGGEEFLICLQNTTSKGAVILAQKILESIRKIKYVLDSGKVVSFTVSIGIAGCKEHKMLDQLIKESDDALYKAKKSGRDRFVVYETTF